MCRSELSVNTEGTPHQPYLHEQRVEKEVVGNGVAGLCQHPVQVPHLTQLGINVGKHGGKPRPQGRAPGFVAEKKVN